MSDEGLREIELKGKQLVFLFMAATVISVVIFLCGVMVGRGVKVPQTVVEAADDPTLVPASTAPEDELPTAEETATPDLRYPDILDEPRLPREKLVSATPPAAAPEPAFEPIPVPGPAPVATSAKAVSTPEPAGTGWVVQVMATTTRVEAESVARRLGTKGYTAFVTLADVPTRNKFRVRVGKFNDRREAESIAQRLQKEEQFKPWITR